MTYAIAYLLIVIAACIVALCWPKKRKYRNNRGWTLDNFDIAQTIATKHRKSRKVTL